VQLYDTARREVVALEPGPVVSMYSCGITPYDAAHLGHAAVYLYFDMLQRRLQDAGHVTRCVRNVTDVDDDILRKARELGVHYLDLAAEEMARFDAEMGLLNLLPVYSEPRATSAISEILSLIGEALEGGHAYESGGSVYFSVATFSEFGRISGYDRAHMLALATEQGGHPDQGGPGGTSSARPSCCASSARRSTSTEAAGIWCSRTTSARPPSRSP
jgi:L-cysteine:1D-myo-inositol 2-amino-2-deoxy-alpha-D-glucopyranoside ligase